MKAAQPEERPFNGGGARLDRRDALWLLAIIALAFALRGYYLLQLRHTPTFEQKIMDPLYHHEWAKTFAAGDTYIKGPYFRAPLYPWFLGSLYWLMGSDTLGPRLVQAVLGSMSCALLYLVGRTAFRRTVGAIAGIIAATYWMLIYFDVELLIVVLIVFLDLLLLLLLLRARHRDGKRLWLAAGVVLGLSALARPNILLFAPAVVIWIATLHRPMWPRVPAYAACFAAGAALVILPITYRNYHVGHDLVLISSQAGVNFYIGNNPESDGMQAVVPGTSAEWWPGYYQSIARAEQATGRQLKPSEVSQYYAKQAFRFMREQPARAAALMSHKLRCFWTHWEIPNNAIIQFSVDYYTPFLNYLPFRFWLIGPFGLLGLLVSFKEAKRLFPIWGFVLVYMISVVLFFVTARYRMPAIPVLILLAAYAACWLLDAVRQRRGRRLAFGGVVLALGGLLVAPTPVDPQFQIAQGYRAAGVTQHQLGALDEAEFLLREATRLAPQWAPAWTALAHLKEAQGRPDEVTEVLRKALTYIPDDAEVLGHLGYTYLGLQRLGEARQYLMRAATLRPDDPLIQRNLGLALATSGQVVQAVAPLTRAVELAPDDPDARQGLGQALVQAGRLAEGEAQLRRVLEMQPERADTLAALGTTVALGQNFAEAASLFQRAASIDPIAPMVYGQWAQALSQCGDQEGALNALQTGLTHLPDNVQLMHQLALRLATLPPPLGKPAEAVTLAERVCHMDGGRNPVSLFTAALAYASNEQCDLALVRANQALPLAQQAGRNVLVDRLQALIQECSGQGPR